MRDRLLIRHFFWRFLEHDLVSSSADRRVVLAAALGLLTALGLFAAVLVAMPYQFFNEMPRGLVSLQSLDDRFLFVSMSMLVMALAAAGQWDALALDDRDAAVLGPLPVPHWLIVRSKFAATGIFASAVLIAWNVCPTLLRSAAVPLGLRISWSGMLRLTLAHAVIVAAAGTFGFLAILALRESAYALCGQARLRRISTGLQAFVMVLLMTALLLLLLPGHTNKIGRRWLGTTESKVRLIPPIWFVGLHEQLVGSVIETGRVVEDVPRVMSKDRVARDDAAAAAVYRNLRPVFRPLARRAVSAWLIVATVAIAACLWNSRRLPAALSRPAGRAGLARRAWSQLAKRLVATTPIEQAGFFFALQSVFRRPGHRLTMAASAAAALSLVIVTGLRPAAAIDDPASPSITLLATQSLVIGMVVAGFRSATRAPSDSRGSLTFGLAWPGTPVPFVAGVKRAGWIGLLQPTLIAMFIWHTGIVGVRVALLHAGMGAAVAMVMMEASFFHNRRVPLASVYPPLEDVKLVVMLIGVALLAASFAVAAVEKTVLENPILFLGLLAGLLGVGLCLRRCDHVSPTATIELEHC